MPVSIRAGGGPFSPPALLPVSFQMSDPSARGWTVTQHPVAVYGGGKTFFSYADTDGDAYVVEYDHASETASTPFGLHGGALTAGGDPHDAASLVIRPDGRLIAHYTAHNIGSTIYQRISTNAYDATAWGSESSLDAQLGGTLYTYPKPVYLSDESNRLYLFYRNIPSGNTGHLEYSTSDDDGATWAATTRVYGVPSNEITYPRITTNGTDRIDVCGTTKTPDVSDPAAVVHYYYAAGDWHDSDGTVLTLPITSATATEVFPNTDGSAISGGMAYDGSGNPVTLLLLQNATTIDVRQARWDGAAWDVVTLQDGVDAIDDNAWFPATQAYDSADVAYSVRLVGSFFEMFRWTYDGTTWTEDEQLTASSADNHFQPVPVWDANPSIRVVWLFGDGGTAPNYDDADVALWGGH